MSSSVKCGWSFWCSEIMHVKPFTLCTWHRVLRKTLLLLRGNRYERGAWFSSFLVHTTPFYQLCHSGVVFLRRIHCESRFPPFFIVVLLTDGQQINHREKKLLHSRIGASQLQEVSAGEGNKESWTSGQRSNCTFVCSWLSTESLPADCRLLESDIWECLCKIK